MPNFLKNDDQPDGDLFVEVESKTKSQPFKVLITLESGWCIKAPAPLEWCVGKHRVDLSRHFKRHLWKATIVELDPDDWL